MVKIMIGENEAGQRVDRFLRKYLGGAPLSAIYRIIRKDLKVNGRRVREDTLLTPGDEVTLYMTQEQLEASRKPARTRPSARRQFQIVYEDDQSAATCRNGESTIRPGRRHSRRLPRTGSTAIPAGW